MHVFFGACFAASAAPDVPADALTGGDELSPPALIGASLLLELDLKCCFWRMARLFARRDCSVAPARWSRSLPRARRAAA